MRECPRPRGELPPLNGTPLVMSTNLNISHIYGNTFIVKLFFNPLSAPKRSLGQNLRLTNLLKGNHIYDFLKLERWDPTSASKTGEAQNLGFELLCSPLQVGDS